MPQAFCFHQTSVLPQRAKDKVGQVSEQGPMLCDIIMVFENYFMTNSQLQIRKVRNLLSAKEPAPQGWPGGTFSSHFLPETPSDEAELCILQCVS